jgi:hypothetical protein
VQALGTVPFQAGPDVGWGDAFAEQLAHLVTEMAQDVLGWTVCACGGVLGDELLG